MNFNSIIFAGKPSRPIWDTKELPIGGRGEGRVPCTHITRGPLKVAIYIYVPISLSIYTYTHTFFFLKGRRLWIDDF